MGETCREGRGKSKDSHISATALKKIFRISSFYRFLSIKGGYCTVARGYDFYSREANNILRTSAASKILFLARENKIHIF